MNIFSIYLLVLIIIMFSSIVRGSTGFGLAMTSMPLLTLLMPFRDAVSLVVLVNLMFSIIHISRSEGYLNKREFASIILFAAAGVSAGVFILKYVNPDLLKAFAGFVIILFAISYLRGFTIKTQGRSFAFILSSFAGGLFAGCASIGGPAAAMFLSGTKMDSREFRYAMSVFFLVSYSYAAIMQGVTGILKTDTLILALLSLPFLLAGIVVGEKLTERIDKDKFRIIIITLLLISGSIIIYRGINSLL